MNKTVIFCCAFLIGTPVLAQQIPTAAPAAANTAKAPETAVPQKTPAAKPQSSAPEAATSKTASPSPITIMESPKPAVPAQPQKPETKAPVKKAAPKRAEAEPVVEVDMEPVDAPPAVKAPETAKAEPAPQAKTPPAQDKQAPSAKEPAAPVNKNAVASDKEKPAPVPPAKPSVPPAEVQKSSAPAPASISSAPVAAVPPAVIMLETSAASVPFDNTVPPPATPKPSYSEIAASIALLLELTPEEKSVLDSRLALEDKAYDALKKKYDEMGTEIAKRRKELLLLREEYDRVTAHSYVAEIINDRLEPDQKEKYRTMLEEEKAARAARLAPPVKIEAPKTEEPKAAPAPVKKEPAKKPVKAKKPKAAHAPAPAKAQPAKKPEAAGSEPPASMLNPGPNDTPPSDLPTMLPSKSSSWRKKPSAAKNAPMTGAIPGMNEPKAKPAQ